MVVVQLEDVNGRPQVRKDELSDLRVGDPVRLKFRITRENAGRHETLVVDNQFRVTTLSVDASVTPPRRILSVESVHKPPTWRSIRKTHERPSLAPAKSPRTPI